MFTLKNQGPARKTEGRAKPWRLILAGGLVACAVGGVAVGIAWATPGSGITSTNIAGPSLLLGNLKVKSESDINEVEFEAKGASDVWVVQNVVAPGGHTGWHSHPGFSIISVVAGQATEYRSDEPGGIVHPAGTSFIDEGGDHAHLVANEGITNLVLVAFQVLPNGAPRRIDVPAP
jgi:quercetin dioxygenase-like cupin family protein